MISNYQDLILATREQPEPQRLLFVFCRSELPDEARPKRRRHLNVVRAVLSFRLSAWTRRRTKRPISRPWLKNPGPLARADHMHSGAEPKGYTRCCIELEGRECSKD